MFRQLRSIRRVSGELTIGQHDRLYGFGYYAFKTERTLTWNWGRTFVGIQWVA